MSIFDGLILVTGGAGFIGSALVWALNQRGHDRILIADYLGSDEKWRNLAPLRFHDYLEADRLLEQLNAGGLAEVRSVFHLVPALPQPSATAATLSRITMNTHVELPIGAAGNRRFVYASSAATYGDGSAGMRDGHEHLEGLVPLNMYGYSKHLFDKYAARQGWLDRIVGLKFFNVFGPNENHKEDMRSVVAKAFEQIGREGRVRLFKSYRSEIRDGEQHRDFLYVKDAVEMTLHLAERSSANGIFNIGSGKASTWLDLVTPIFHALQRPVNIEFIDMPDALRGKYQYYTCADTSRLRGTGWTGIQYQLADAVTDYVGNFLAPDLRLGQTRQGAPS